MLLLLSTICPHCQLQSKIKESFILHLKNIYVNLPLNLVHLRDLSVAIQQAELPENSFTLCIIIQMHIIIICANVQGCHAGAGGLGISPNYYKGNSWLLS